MMLGAACDSGIWTGIGNVLSVGERRDESGFEGVAMGITGLSPYCLHTGMRFTSQ